MGDSITELVDAVYGDDEFLRRPVHMRERGVQRVIPQSPTSRVVVGEEETPRAEGQLRE